MFFFYVVCYSGVKIASKVKCHIQTADNGLKMFTILKQIHFF